MRHLPVNTMQTQRLRRLAVHVLLAWLFALGTGIANACVVQPALRDCGQAASHEHFHAAPDPAHGQAHGVAGHAHSASDTAPCERLCDQPSAVPQAAKQQTDVMNGLSWLAPAPLPVWDFRALPAVNAVIDGTPIFWRATVPIPIAFLRLAL